MPFSCSEREILVVTDLIVDGDGCETAGHEESTLGHGLHLVVSASDDRQPVTVGDQRCKVGVNSPWPCSTTDVATSGSMTFGVTK